jgi:hypothetical protein
MALASVPLELPAPVHLPDDADPTRIGAALSDALTSRKWTVESQNLTSVTARIETNGRTLRVRLDYTPHDVSYHYVDSRDLGYYEEQGSIFVLPKANKWLEQLDGAVRARVRQLGKDAEPAEVVPVDPAQR